MSRLQKKCLIGSAGFHLLLVVIMFVGPAFLSLTTKHKQDDPQVVTIFDPRKLTDGPTITGGTPSQPPPPAPEQQPEPPAPQPQPVIKPAQPEPAEPEPPKAKPVPKPDSDATEPVKEKAKPKATAEDSETPKKPKIQVNTTLKKVSPASKPGKTDQAKQDEAKAQRDAARRAREQAFNSVLKNLDTGLSSGTDVNIIGPGPGTFVNYAEAVRIKYTAAWIAPTDVTDEEATAKVSVTIARDGSVISAHIKTPSGSAPVDNSVEQTLRRVKFIAPFPEGATDAERTFIINFNLKAKRSLG